MTQTCQAARVRHPSPSLNFPLWLAGGTIFWVSCFVFGFRVSFIEECTYAQHNRARKLCFGAKNNARLNFGSRCCLLFSTEKLIVFVCSLVQKFL